MDYFLDNFLKHKIKTGELEEIELKRLQESNNNDKYEVLKNNEVIKKLSYLTGCDVAKSIYLTYEEFLKIEEIKERLKYKNEIERLKKEIEKLKNEMIYLKLT